MKFLKQALLSICLGLCATVAFAQQSSIYYEGTFDLAISLARRMNRYVIVEFYAKWSHQSRWNNEKTLTNPSVISLLANRFVVVQADVQTDQGAALALDYQVNTYPNMVIFDPWGNAILRVDKNLEPQDFINLLEQTTSSSNVDRNSATVRQIIISAQKYGPGEPLIEKATADYLSKLSVIEAMGSTNWELFENSLTMYYNSPSYKYLIENHPKANIIAGKSKIDNTLYNAILPKVMEQAIGSGQYDSVAIGNIEQLNIETLVPWITLAKARQASDLDTYMWQVEQMVDMGSMSDHDFSLILSLELVANSPEATKTQKHRAIKIVTSAIRETISPSKSTLLDGLIGQLKR